MLMCGKMNKKRLNLIFGMFFSSPVYLEQNRFGRKSSMKIFTRGIVGESIYGNFFEKINERGNIHK